MTEIQHFSIALIHILSIQFHHFDVWHCDNVIYVYLQCRRLTSLYHHQHLIERIKISHLRPFSYWICWKICSNLNFYLVTNIISIWPLLKNTNSSFISRYNVIYQFDDSNYHHCSPHLEMYNKIMTLNHNLISLQGATFFNSSEEDGHLVNPSQPAQPHHFVPLKTIKHCTFHIIVSTAISIVGIVLAVREPDLDHKCRAYFIMLYLHGAYWFFTLVSSLPCSTLVYITSSFELIQLNKCCHKCSKGKYIYNSSQFSLQIIDYILKKTHHSLRIRGYLEFYQKTYTLHRLPIYIVSLWNALLLIVQTLVQHIYPDDFVEQCIKGGIVTPVSYVTGFIWLESIVLYVTHGFYIGEMSFFMRKLRMGFRCVSWLYWNYHFFYRLMLEKQFLNCANNRSASTFLS